ncbi:MULTISPECIES: RNA polymerase sigma factor [Anaerotruncus]|jgi:RNA polymerase sigma factor (sigma-70 family)|uniref:RNA polymerase sigma factor n=1 Tax=Anaerotruncus TaxID=244127 RepID=UPI000834AEE4|nr:MULTISPECIES: RNA polymerase sigma factor [Anaerotruncus]RGX54391.1 RNA polymerase sigma factor [Anaerotruncus sp. AF02-27]
MLLFATIQTETKPPALTDEMMLLVAQGDGDAFARLYHATQQAVYCLLLSIVKNHALAEDLMQDTYLSVKRSIGSYQPRGKPLAWIFTVAKNLAYMELRKKRETADFADYENFLTKDDTVSSVDKLVLQKTLEILEDRDRQIVLLHAVAGLKFREVAAQLEMPIGSALSAYNRAIKKLQKAMKEAGY